MHFSNTALAITLGLASIANAANLRGLVKIKPLGRRRLSGKDDLDDAKCNVSEVDDSDIGLPIVVGDKAAIECKGDNDFQATLTLEVEEDNELFIELCVEADKRKRECEEISIDDLDDAIDEAEKLFQDEATALVEKLFDRHLMGDSKDDADDRDDLADLLEDTFEDYDLKCKVDEAESDNGVPEEDGDKAEIKCEGDNDLEVTLTYEIKEDRGKEELDIELCVEADKGKKVCEATKIDDVDDAIDISEGLIKDEAKDLLQEALGN